MFYLYDDPYLKLGTANGGYTSIETYVPYFVKDDISDLVANKYYCVFHNGLGQFYLQPIWPGYFSGSDRETFYRDSAYTDAYVGDTVSIYYCVTDSTYYK